MKTLTVTKAEARRRGAPQMKGMRVKILSEKPGPQGCITYRVEWPCDDGWVALSRKKPTGGGLLSRLFRR
jgi:hypothetical protein